MQNGDNSTKQLVIEPIGSVAVPSSQELEPNKIGGCCGTLKHLQKKTRELIEKAGFSICIVLLILANTLIMAVDHYNMSD